MQPPILAPAILLSALVWSGCSQDAKPPAQPCYSSPKCGECEFFWDDTVGQAVLTDAGAVRTAKQVGDLECHRSCAADSDCAGLPESRCVTLGLFGGGDVACKKVVHVCAVPRPSNCSCDGVKPGAGYCEE